MQFITNGPDVPERLLQAHEDGNVVFFCGAGVSYPAGLPGFGGLVRRLFERLNTEPSKTEEAAIKESRFDSAIGLLEERIVGDRLSVRQAIGEILTPRRPPHWRHTATHKALLTLARTRSDRVRLVTTNFDRLFERVITDGDLGIEPFKAPFLPIPKERWDGLVYLHGLLPTDSKEQALDRLILSSGDFGLAYLTERWAAQFVGELFRRYTVCFVGYSINDPVLRYMTDALAADQLRGEPAIEMFAFGSAEEDKEDEIEEVWRAKGVTPVLYRETIAHEYLHRTLREWSKTYRDGISGKASIVVRHALSRPQKSTRQDDFVGRVLWALSDKSGGAAKQFVDLKPTPSLDWLYPLADALCGYDDLARFGVQPNVARDEGLKFSLLDRPSPYSLSAWMSPVAAGGNRGRWDVVMSNLARWLATHVNDPALLIWVAKNGGTLHPHFSDLVTSAIEKQKLSSAMQVLWQLALVGRIEDQQSVLVFFKWKDLFNQFGMTAPVRLQLRDLLRPLVRISEPYRGLDEKDQDEPADPNRMNNLVRWEIVLTTQHAHSSLGDIRETNEWAESLPDLLSDATDLLIDVLDLMRELGSADRSSDLSYLSRPSISDHHQNNTFRDWTVLIEIARDGWLATAGLEPARAQRSAENWFSIQYPLFKRLAFFAAAQPNIIPPQAALDWLLSEEGWWLWSIETKREVIRLIASLAPRLSAEELEILIREILIGPPREMYRRSLDAVEWKETVDRAIWFRLMTVEESGAEIEATAANVLCALSEAHPGWRLAPDGSDEFPYWVESDYDLLTTGDSPIGEPELANWLAQNRGADPWNEDDWRTRCRNDLPVALGALLRLARLGDWVTGRWSQALFVWSEEPFAQESWPLVGPELARAPNEVVAEISSALGSWLKSVARSPVVDDVGFFELVDRIVVLCSTQPSEDQFDSVTQAINHPIGQVTESVLRWWYRRPLEDGEGLVERVKHLFTILCDTRIVGYRNGRVLLAAHLISLFRVDEDWTRKHLLPLFNWEDDSGEAQAVWQGFLWSPRLFARLMRSMKREFLSAAEHFKLLGDYKTQYANLLTFTALESKEILTSAELRKATNRLPVKEGLEVAAETLVLGLNGAGEQRSKYWKNRVLPYIREIWPNAKRVRTDLISEVFSRLCIATGESFPDAVKELKPWFQHLRFPGVVVSQLLEAGQCSRFPIEALAFLDLIVGGGEALLPSSLRTCLDEIKGTKPDLATTEAYRRLFEL